MHLGSWEVSYFRSVLTLKLCKCFYHALLASKRELTLFLVFLFLLWLMSFSNIIRYEVIVNVSMTIWPSATKWSRNIHHVHIFLHKKLKFRYYVRVALGIVQVSSPKGSCMRVFVRYKRNWLSPYNLNFGGLVFEVLSIGSLLFF